MKYDFINSGTLTLAYAEKNPEIPQTLVFIHGSSGSSQIWQQIWHLDEFHLLAIDLPGHGQSEHSNDPVTDYSPAGTGKLIAETIHLLVNTKPYILVGFSYGTNVLAEALAYKLRPAGIVLIGSSVFGAGIGLDKILLPVETPSIFNYNESSTAVINSFFSTHVPNGTAEQHSQLVEYYRGVDQQFKPWLFDGVGAGKFTDEIMAIQATELPVLVIAGKEDKIINPHYLDHQPFHLWQNRVHKIPHTGHWSVCEKSAEVSALVKNYATERFNVE